MPPKTKTYAELLKQTMELSVSIIPAGVMIKINFHKNAQESIETVYKYLIQKGIKPGEYWSSCSFNGVCSCFQEFAGQNKIGFTVLVSPFNKARDEVKYYIDRTNLKPIEKKIMKYLPSFLLPLKFTLNNEKS